MNACVYTENFKCGECGKLKYKNDTWIYKRKGPKERLIYFCSYGCMRKWDKEHEKAKGGARA